MIIVSNSMDINTYLFAYLFIYNLSVISMNECILHFLKDDDYLFKITKN